MFSQWTKPAGTDQKDKKETNNYYRDEGYKKRNEYKYHY